MLLVTNRKSINLCCEWPSAVELHRYLRGKGRTLQSRQNQINNSMFSSVFKIALAGMCQRAPSISDMWAWNKKFSSAPLIFATCQVFLFLRCCTSKPRIVRMEVPPGQAGKICQIYSMILAWW